MPQFNLLQIWNFETARVHGYLRNHRYKAPKWLTIDNGMLNKRCRDGLSYVFICTGAPGWDVTSPNQSTVHFGTLEWQGRMGIDAVAILKNIDGVDGSKLSRQCRDDTEH